MKYLRVGEESVAAPRPARGYTGVLTASRLIVYSDGQLS